MLRRRERGGAPHVPIEVIWADIQTRVLGWGHCIIFVDALGPGGWGHRTFYLRVPGQMSKLSRDPQKILRHLEDTTDTLMRHS